MPAPDAVYKLTEHFEQNLDAYKHGKYNETQVRVEFINPLFIALGWDVRNEHCKPEAVKDVIHEAAIKIGGVTKAPDYSFRINGYRKFFLEAKKPSVDIKHDTHPAFQLRRYAWSIKLPVSILTDFEEFAVYDCRVEPNKKDRASVARLFYYKYTDYVEKWDDVASLFSRDAVQQGSLERYIDTHKVKRGAAEVDTAFLHEIEEWRDTLARNIALRNPGIVIREINYSVQLIIDRIIFLRICEDRGIEQYGKLMSLQNGTQTYPRMVHMFRKADDRYNSGLFYFIKEKNRFGYPDNLTPNLNIDDNVIKRILKKLYFPDSPYEFSVLPADILGQVYEGFLGKVIRLTKSGRAKVEEKPEVRKAGGVFYTPTYIVDYIIKHTVGKYLKGKKPGPKGGVSKLRILDPACGSGSFLISAYQYLLDWHLEHYINDGPEKWASKSKPQLYQTDHHEWRLTIDERKRILRNNIYGVDIDPQAVEVTKLSLLLKVLEGESDETLRPQLALFPDRVLPDLVDNIRCGNSLIGPEFFTGQRELIEEDAYRINSFDWKSGFPEIFGEGGFDVVIGNPPYIRIQHMKEWAPVEVEFYKEKYRSASKGNYDIYLVFVEKGLGLLNTQGRLGFILPHKFFNAKYGEALRGILTEGKNISDIIHFGDEQVFTGATTYTCLLFLDKKPQKKFRFVKAHNLKAWRNGEEQSAGDVLADKVSSSEWNFVVGQGAKLFERLSNSPVKLVDVTRIFVGLQTDADDVYILERIKNEGNKVVCKSKYTGESHLFEDSHLKEFVKGSVNIRRYYLSDLKKRLIFPYEKREDKSVLISPKEYRKRFPLTWKYLNTCKSRLTARNKGKMDGAEWYGYVYKKNHTRLDNSKLLVPSIAEGSCFAPDLEGRFFFVGSGGGGGGGYGISLNKDISFSVLYLLGVLNSKLLEYYLKCITTPFRGGYIALNRQYISELPVRTIDFERKEHRNIHDKLVTLVECMIDQKKQQGCASVPHSKDVLQRQISSTDQQIDALVYELYGLSEEEIAIVEGL